ncbi:uncharacterized protein [Paramisgurnus dabryanus]|uniref:uncharacterized protein n=1 Tax=Paramisgurnus dabryanus TaxID=90735 RepID=UPI003CCF630D
MKMLMKLTLVFVVTLLYKGCDCQLDVCGRAPLNTKIVGGQESQVGAWPWQISFHLKEFGHICGGSLINAQWVLTAAHCVVNNLNPSSYLVYLGRHSQELPNPFEVARNVSLIIPHPAYDANSNDNDMALLQLSAPVNFTAHIGPVCLAADGSIFGNGTDMWLTGWGNIQSGVSLPSPQNLQEVDVPIVGNGMCNCLYGEGKITSNMICAGLMQGGKDTCQGDSGGPMVIKQGPVWIQSGVVSFGQGCALPNYPGVYSRVSQYQNWITGYAGAVGFVSAMIGLPDDQTNVTCPPILCGGQSTFFTGDWSMMASLRFFGSPTCTGTVISPNYVLTSASCFMGAMMPFQWTVTVGFVPGDCTNSMEITYSVAQIIISPNSNNDVALVELAYASQLPYYINAANVNVYGYDFPPGTECSVVGWNGMMPGLEEFQATIVPCNNPYINSELNICTTPVNVQQDDQGSPLMCKLGEMWVQAGVLSLDYILGENVQVFRKTSQFTPFMYENVNNIPSVWDGVESFSPLSLTFVLLLSLPAILQALVKLFCYMFQSNDPANTEPSDGVGVRRSASSHGAAAAHCCASSPLLVDRGGTHSTLQCALESRRQAGARAVVYSDGGIGLALMVAPHPLCHAHFFPVCCYSQDQVSGHPYMPAEHQGRDRPSVFGEQVGDYQDVLIAILRPAQCQEVHRHYVEGSFSMDGHHRLRQMLLPDWRAPRSGTLPRPVSGRWLSCRALLPVFPASPTVPVAFSQSPSGLVSLMTSAVGPVPPTSSPDTHPDPGPVSLSTGGGPTPSSLARPPAGLLAPPQPLSYSPPHGYLPLDAPGARGSPPLAVSKGHLRSYALAQADTVVGSQSWPAGPPTAAQRPPTSPSVVLELLAQGPLQGQQFQLERAVISIVPLGRVEASARVGNHPLDSFLPLGQYRPQPQNLQAPVFFCTSTMGAAQGLLLSLTMPRPSMPCKSVRTSAYKPMITAGLQPGKLLSQSQGKSSNGLSGALFTIKELGAEDGYGGVVTILLGEELEYGLGGGSDSFRGGLRRLGHKDTINLTWIALTSSLATALGKCRRRLGHKDTINLTWIALTSSLATALGKSSFNKGMKRGVEMPGCREYISSNTNDKVRKMKMLMKLTLVFVVTLLYKGCDCQLDVCGRAPLNTKIVGGQESQVGAWPWQISFHLKEVGHICGGSLINAQWVLTAAHCVVNNLDPSSYLVYLGRHSQQLSNPFEVARNVSLIIPHPAYDANSNDNDMALLQLSAPVNFTAHIGPVCLAADGSIFGNGTDMWLTGWGNIQSGVSLPSPQNLQEVDVPIVGNGMCNCLYGEGKITSNMICAGLMQGGKDTCQGDSGGPMVIKQGPVWIQSGVVSFGEGCALPNYPGVYSRVSQYQNWITGYAGAVGFVSAMIGLPDDQTNVTCPPILCGGQSTFFTGDWSMMASLRLFGVPTCTGTVISPNYVLTSASCFMGAMMPFQWTVTVGFVPGDCTNSMEITYSVAQIIISPNSNNDVALVELASQLPYYINTANVNVYGYDFPPGTECSVVGWSAGNGMMPGLEEFQATIVPCNNPYINSELNICTTPVNVQQDDQGSPLMCKLGEMWVQAGVLSLDYILGENVQVFRKTSQFTPFMYENVNNIPSVLDGVESFSPLSLTFVLLLSLPAILQALY